MLYGCISSTPKRRSTTSARCAEYYTHHRRRSNPNHFSVNVACLAGVSPFDFECVPVFDGVTHPKDRPGGSGYAIAGYLRYENATC